VQVIEDIHQAMLHSIFTAMRESLTVGTAKVMMAKAASF
jgi:hypothetical protein